MTFSAETLAAELEKMVPTKDDGEGNQVPVTEQDAINAFASAFETYFYEAVAGDGLPEPVISISVAPGSLSACTAALKTGLAGISTESNGSTVIQTGITAFWTTAVANVATIFPGCTPLVAPVAGLAGIKVALDAVFLSNTSEEKTLEDAATAIAEAIDLTQIGGTTTYTTGPVALTIT